MLQYNYCLHFFVENGEQDGDVPFIPQLDRSSLIIYQAECEPEPLIVAGRGNKTGNAVEVSWVLLVYIQT